jgi:sporulation protein YlmC with PRC-barrel domain
VVLNNAEPLTISHLIMKISLICGAIVAILSLAVAPSNAQIQTSTSSSSSAYIQTSKIVGTTVKSAQGEEIGTIKDVVLDSNTGCMAYTVLSTGGTAARVTGSARTVAVPWSVYSVGSDPRVVTVRVEKEKIYNAPVFDYARINEYSTSGYINNVYTHYGVSPSVGVGVGVGVSGSTTTTGTTATGTNTGTAYGASTTASAAPTATAAPATSATVSASPAMSASPSASASASVSASASPAPSASASAASTSTHGKRSEAAREKKGDTTSSASSPHRRSDTTSGSKSEESTSSSTSGSTSDSDANSSSGETKKARKHKAEKTEGSSTAEPSGTPQE